VNAAFADLEFNKNEWGQLVLSAPDGSRYVGVEPVRCFPLSDPDRLIAILDSDGREIVNIPNMEVLNPVARDRLRQELIEREFVPVIQKIHSTSVANAPCVVDVVTDRGATRFHLESEDDIRRLGHDGVVIADSNGIRYLIRDINSLDSHSQRIIRRLF